MNNGLLKVRKNGSQIETNITCQNVSTNLMRKKRWISEEEADGLVGRAGRNM